MASEAAFHLVHCGNFLTNSGGSALVLLAGVVVRGIFSFVFSEGTWLVLGLFLLPFGWPMIESKNMFRWSMTVINIFVTCCQTLFIIF